MDYLDWQSQLSLKKVFGEKTSFEYPSILNRHQTLYLERSKEDNRSILTLLTRDLSGNQHDNKFDSITPVPFSLQTRVNEYGGKPYWVFDSAVVFANQVDQCLYRQALTEAGFSAPQRVSYLPDDQQRFMYTDVHQCGDSHYLAIIEVERSDVPHANNAMFIGAISNDPNVPPYPLIEGANFYSNFVINPSQDRAAWVQWDHPNMPWDDTQLFSANIVQHNGRPALTNVSQITVSDSGSAGASVCQLLFASDQRLFFSADYRVDCTRTSNSGEPSKGFEDYWNVHVFDFSNQKLRRVTSDYAEYGYPHWVYGDHRIVRHSDTDILTVLSDPCGDRIVKIDQQTLEVRPLQIKEEPCTIQHLHSDGRGASVFELLPFDGSPGLVKFESSGSASEFDLLRLIEADSALVETSPAIHMSFTDQGGVKTHGFYYAPVNSPQQAITDDNALPPLLVMVHGGPTARAYGHFDLQKQFWTSRGFAILDVNHRGSSGYGRHYRDALYGQWGEHDTSDIISAINSLIDQQKVDPKRICIRGKSAGGYAVLRALTEHPDTFRAGACYYGIGNLVTLAESTHKFEKHYTNRLVDEVFDPEFANSTDSHFFQRSPINKMNQLKSAMIVFQGGLDRVVPPSVAQEIIGVLQNANADHQYVEYPNEAHGFKRPENNIDAWQKELDFYRRVLRT